MKRILWMIFSMLLSGCSSFLTEVSDVERLEQVTGIDKHSSYPAVRRDAFEKVNILELVDPENNAKLNFPENWKWADESQNKSVAMGAKYDLSMAYFRQRKDITDDEKRRRRDSIQERILSVSISRCNVFKTFLRRDQADKNFLLGTATTVSAVLGAVIPGADAARNLAGTAGIFSGIRSEYNQAYYASLAAHVIVKGIETRQEIVYRRIQSEGQSKSIVGYPLEAAIKDAIYFDGLCSVVAGLDQAAASVDATTEPGVDAAMRTLLRARLLKEAADMPSESLLKPETLKAFGFAGASLGMSLVGSVREEPTTPASDTDLFLASSKMIERIKAAANDAAMQIEKAALARKKVLLDQLKFADSDKERANKQPKEGELMVAIHQKLTQKLLAPLKLEACYLKLAGSAVGARDGAVKQFANATNEEAKAAAKVLLTEADGAFAVAHGKFRLKEAGVLWEIKQYRDERMAEIMTAKVQESDAKPDLDKTLLTLKEMAGKEPSTLTVGKSPSCTD